MASAKADGTLDVRLIGRVAVRTMAGWRDEWPRPASRRLVALLVLSPTRSAPREVVADRLFGHLPADRALRNVSKALSLARSVVGPGIFLGDSATLWIAESVEVRTDLAQDTEQAHRALVSPPPPEGWADLRALLARADQLLSEDLYEDWAQDVRRDHEALTREAALALAHSSGLGTDWGRVLTHDPCDVEAWSAVLTAAAGRGPAELDAAYAECRLVHAQGLQGPPPAALRRLTEGLRQVPSSPAESDVTVGHEAELRWIGNRVGVTARGGDSWVVYGPAGIGKTHLLCRATASLRDQACLVQWATCVAADAGGPFAPLSSALRLAHTGSHPVVDVLERGGSGGSQGWSAVRLADDVAAVLDAYAERLVLVVDDVHWADPALKSLLSRLCALASGRRWSLLMAGRSDEADHPLPSVPSSTASLRVTALTPQETAVLARRLLGHDRATDPVASESVVQALVTRSGGNPFFLTELARGAGGAPLTGGDLPERVHALLRRRLSLITTASHHALALTALAGERATVPLLARVLGEQEADRSVRELRSHSLLSTTSAPRPVHPLLREVVVADLTAVQTCEVHDQLARALTGLAQESDRRDLADAAAGHALSAYTAYPTSERAPGAAAAGLASGGRMLRSFTPEAAANILEEALAAFADSAADDKAGLVPAAVGGWLDLGRCRLLLGDAEGAERAFRAGLELAEQPLDRARCYRRLAALHYRTGRMAETAGVLEVALMDTADELARALLETELGWTLHRRGRASEALPILQRATQVFEDGGSWDLAAWSLDYLAMTHVALGDVDHGLALLDRALARDGVSADHYRRGVLLIHRGGVLRRLGRLEEALGAVNEGIRIVRRTRDRYVLSVGCRIAADIHEAEGDLSGAVSARTEELTLLRGTHNHRHVAMAHAHLASLYRRQGRTQESDRATHAARGAVEQSADADVAEAVAALLDRGNTAGTPGS
ncbi:AAA family ATPase [Ornithinimicrobium cryptoxanthini]|uniref:AAA family ATPase n=1 Tax=Ornithinimicrobium cryptoxanthini TaxID=2934161 RepID=A0ABY4YHJ1_9MICO|nr:AAA family ATPase [Ornithinimicrobium cryptoxanthini]USQ76084.1 AAA family ATPase [Ornithinimicrobium cryptoxanthini]